MAVAVRIQPVDGRETKPANTDHGRKSSVVEIWLRLSVDDRGTEQIDAHIEQHFRRAGTGHAIADRDRPRFVHKTAPDSIGRGVSHYQAKKWRLDWDRL
ncbi:hypothetical protein [Azoarcus sp. DD4]|uniref:hypothetical protein n=1 Tax=Azoarcus sp. DD4 TaxID=2027405 RepID=UPI00112813F2|nr:hypothetical protein [Azoarcus sp. DD4]